MIIHQIHDPYFQCALDSVIYQLYLHAVVSYFWFKSYWILSIFARSIRNEIRIPYPILMDSVLLTCVILWEAGTWTLFSLHDSDNMFFQDWGDAYQMLFCRLIRILSSKTTGLNPILDDLWIMSFLSFHPSWRRWIFNWVRVTVRNFCSRLALPQSRHGRRLL